jgi:hypothetical protein
VIRVATWLKFFVNTHTGNFDADGIKTSERYELSAVYADKGINASWSKWTPTGSMQYTVNNPGAFGALQQSGQYYIALIPASEIDEAKLIDGKVVITIE